MKTSRVAKLLSVFLLYIFVTILLDLFPTLSDAQLPRIPGVSGSRLSGLLPGTAGESLPAAGNSLEARDDTFQAEINAPLIIAAPGLLTNDRITADARAVLVEPPRNGTLTLQPDGSFTYSADADFSGIDRFTYRLVDGIRESGAATVSITVPEVAPEPEEVSIFAQPLAFSAPLIAAITDFSETVDGVPLYWEKAYYQDLDIAGTASLEIPFGLNIPTGYNPAKKTRYPLVIYLHGAGGRSDWTLSSPDPDLRDHSLVDSALIRPTARFFAKAAQSQPSYHAFVLTPQVPSWSKLWVGTGPDIPYTQTDTPDNTYSEYMHLLENLLVFLKDSANEADLASELGFDPRDIDPARIYVVGDSDGAKGAWDILGRQPSLFAGGIAASGTGPANRLNELRQTPLWTIHGVLDDVVINELPSESLPLGSGTLGMLALLDPTFDNTASTELVYKDNPAVAVDDPLPEDSLIYSEFGENFNHTNVAIYWTGRTSGTLPWLFGQARSAVNSPPVAEDQTISTARGTPVAITLSASDADGDPLTYSIDTPPSSGSLSGTPPNLTYAPDIGFAGTDTFTFKADDGMQQSDAATVTVAVTASASATVPDVEGLPQADAEAAIIAAGLTVGQIDSEYSDAVPAGSVISQNPAGGSVVEPGSPVGLVVSIDRTIFTLKVTSAGTGSGTVGGGGTFEVNTIVTPTAVADPGSRFAGWTPVFCGSPFPLTEDTVCTAAFLSDQEMAADGDVAPRGNSDGVVDVNDALLVLRFALEIEVPSDEEIIHADVVPLDAGGRPDPDGVVGVGDALVILRKAMGLVNW